MYYTYTPLYCDWGLNTLFYLNNPLWSERKGNPNGARRLEGKGKTNGARRLRG